MSTVPDNSRDARKVAPTPSSTSPVSSAAEASEAPNPPEAPTKNIVRIAISVGNRPLQGTKLLVSIAMSRSRGESMMRQPTTPAALQPKPIAMVRACLPQARHFLKVRSRLNATRGRYPRSSSSVNRGKKIAMGGSITDTTHASTRYTPSTSRPFTHTGAPAQAIAPPSRSPTQNKPSAKSWDGTFAPVIVSQNTPRSSRSMSGKPVRRLVRIRSSFRSRSSCGVGVQRTAPMHTVSAVRTRLRTTSSCSACCVTPPSARRRLARASISATSGCCASEKPRYRTIPAFSSVSPSKRRSASHRGAGPPVPTALATAGVSNASAASKGCA